MSEFYISNRDGFVRLLETLYNKLINFEKKKSWDIGYMMNPQWVFIDSKS